MRYISLFSGIEAATVAWHDLGWEPVAFCEIDEFPSAVLAHRFPNVPNLGDITKVDWSEYVGSVDLIVGGSPCQSFSISGKREGLKGESGLMFEYIRAVREIRPRYFVWENVPGAFSSEKGEAFRQLLSEMDECGYGLAWRVLDAQFFGVAQRRRRVFLVGSLGSQRAAEILFEPDSLRWDHPSSREKRQDLTRAALHGSQEGGGSGGVAYGMSYKAGAKAQAYPISEELHPTLSASRHDASALIVSDVPCHCLAAQDHPPAIVMASAQANDEITEDFAPAQCARQYKDPPILCVADDNVNAAIDENLCGSLKVGGVSLHSLPSNGEDVIGALCARDFKGVGNQYVSEGKVIVQWNESTR